MVLISNSVINSIKKTLLIVSKNTISTKFAIIKKKYIINILQEIKHYVTIFKNHKLSTKSHTTYIGTLRNGCRPLVSKADDFCATKSRIILEKYENLNSQDFIEKARIRNS